MKKETKKLKSSYLPAYLMLVVAILVAAVLIVGGLYVWYYSTIAGPIAQLANNQQALSEQIQKLDPNATDEVVVEEEKVVEEEVEDWTAFKIESENFEFRYPKDWFVDDNTEQLRENYIGNLFILTQSSAGLLSENGVKIDFNVDQSSQSRSLDDLLSCSISGFEKELISCKQQNIGGKTYKVKSTLYHDGTKTIEMVVINGGNIYSTIGFATTGNEQNENFEMIQEIFNTYRFE